jgi:4-amino-4-deoxy-L-arabinose transferase-like glycosyltransferase
MATMGVKTNNHGFQNLNRMDYLLIFPFVIALYLRISVIGEYGLSEDEVHKAIATQSYLDLNFATNPSHPALMKIFMTLSVLFLGETEFALRLPNAIISSLTIIPIYYLGKELYDELTGYVASLIWATNLPALAFSTVTKEDSFLTFFWVLAIFYFVKLRSNDKYLTHLGVCIGLAAASKYTFIVLLALLLLQYFIVYNRIENFPNLKTSLAKITKVSVITFAIFNFPIFFPSTLYLIIEEIVTVTPSHNGYYMMGDLYETRPWYYLIFYLFVKNTLPLLIASCFGLLHGLKRKTFSNFIVTSWILVPLVIYSVIPLGYTRYLAVILPAMAIIAVRGIIVFSNFIARKTEKSKPNTIIWSGPNFYFRKYFIIVVLSTIIIANSMYTAINIAPYYRMHVNELGGGSERAGYYFPEDSVYDYMVREAIYYINENAPLHSVIPTMIPLVGEYYGRDDLSFVPIDKYPAELDILRSVRVKYIVIQISRIYFENVKLVELLRSSMDPVKVYRIESNNVVEIFQL